jgi:tetratricopeptide (TPR) repeat protein
MTQQPDLTEWDDDLTTSAEEEYAALLRAVRWAQGFGLLFVQCSPADGEQLIERVRADVTEKAIAVLHLEDEIDDLYAAVKTYPGIDDTDVLFITGLEKSLTSYIKPGYGSEGDYYAKDTIPKLLGRLNLQREQFREDFAVCFVFLVPSYAMKYFIRRAADFFDWRSGIWEFVPSAKERQQASERILQEAEDARYLSWTPQQRQRRLYEIEDLLANSNDLTIEVSRLRFEQGNLLLADKNWEAAIVAFDAALAIKPDDALTLLNKGHALNELGRYEEAIVACDAALAIKPDNANVLNKKSYALNELGHHEEAISACDAALAIKPNDAFILVNKSYALNKLDRHEEAVSACEAALSSRPNDVFALINKSSSLNALKRYEEAIAACDAALAIKPDYAFALNNKGLALSELERYEEASTAYDAALTINPSYDMALNNKGHLFYKLGNYEAAVAYCNKALEINPNHQLAKRNLKLALAALEPTFRYEQSAIRLLNEECAALTSEGVRLHRQCHFEEAISYFDQALAKKADYYDAFHHKGVALAAMGHQEAAIDCYDKALKIHPNDHDILCSRGKALLALGRYEDALNDYDRALTLQSKSTTARLGKQNVRRHMPPPRDDSLASQLTLPHSQGFFQRCAAVLSRLWQAVTNFVQSLGRR